MTQIRGLMLSQVADLRDPHAYLKAQRMLATRIAMKLEMYLGAEHPRIHAQSHAS